MRLFLSYITNRTQRSKISLTFSDWINIINNIPQGFIRSFLLSNIFINDLFYFSVKCEICYFAYGNIIVV